MRPPSFFSSVTRFKPITPKKIKPINKTFTIEKGSPKMKISVRTIPPAPIPVKTAYTVPTGKSL